MKLKFLILSIIGGLLTFIASAHGEKAKNSGIISFRLDNDLFAGTDRNYSSGFRLAWVSPDLTANKENSRLPKWLYSLRKWVPLVHRSGFENHISFFLGQNIYTPSDLERSDLVEDDRPYAGMAYIGIGFNSRGKRIMDSLEFKLGIVGVHSLAGQTQKILHDLFGWKYPHGWKNQLHDELALEAGYDHKWKLLQSGTGEGFGYDLIPKLGAGLGNVYAGARIGVEVRWGWNIPDDFGTFLFQPEKEGRVVPSSRKENPFPVRRERSGIHFYAGVEGEAVLRDIFLDGNTFGESHSVEKKTLVANIVAGVAAVSGRFKISFGYVCETKRFKTQKDEHVYGQINLSFSY